MKMKPRTYWGGALFLAVLAVAFPALAEDVSVADTVIHLAYSIDTFYFLMSGALVMWMAAGFSMLEAGLVRSKNTVEILTKNVALYCHRLYHVHDRRLQPDVRRRAQWSHPWAELSSLPDNAVDDVLKSGGEIYYSGTLRLFLPGGVRGNRHVDCLRCRCRAHEALGLPGLCHRHDRLYLPGTGVLEMGRRLS